MGADRGGGHRDRRYPGADQTRRYRGGEEPTRRDLVNSANRDEERERGGYDPYQDSYREREAREERERRRADDARRRYYEQQYGYYDEYTGQWVPGRADDSESRSQVRTERAKWTGIVVVSIVAAIAAVWVTLAVVNAPSDEAAAPAEPVPQQTPQEAPQQPAPQQPAPQQGFPQQPVPQQPATPQQPQIPQGPSAEDQSALRREMAELRQSIEELRASLAEWLGIGEEEPGQGG